MKLKTYIEYQLFKQVACHEWVFVRDGETKEYLMNYILCEEGIFKIEEVFQTVNLEN